MSRLNYMEEEDEALLSLRDDLEILERYKSSGREFTADQQLQIRQLVGRLVQLVGNVDWINDEEPLPEWLRRKAPEPEMRKRRASGG
jgi:hypothetical protein